MNRHEAAKKLLIECQRLTMPLDLRGRIDTHLEPPPRGRPRRIDRVELARLLASGLSHSAAAAVLSCHVSSVTQIVAKGKKSLNLTDQNESFMIDTRWTRG